MQVARLLPRAGLSFISATIIRSSSSIGGHFCPHQARFSTYFGTKLYPLYNWGKGPQGRIPVFWQQASCKLGRRIPSILGLAAAAGLQSVCFDSEKLVRCEEAIDKSNIFVPSVQENQNDWDEGHSPLLIWLRRLWVPLLLVMTAVMGWHYPVSLTVNLVFLLWSTKPTPSSIYIWVEQKRLQAAQHKFGLDRLKAQLSNASMVMHVEVRDYALFCLAQISSLTQKMIVVGILGDWWVLYSSSSSITGGFNLGSLLPVLPPHQW